LAAWTEAAAAERCRAASGDDWIARTRDLASIADCMAGAFFAGYQIAVARTFPEFDRPGASCFAATTRDGAVACTLTLKDDGARLGGEKTWVAGVDHLDRLVVLVETNDGPAFLDVPAEAPGVTLNNLGPSRFLVELSQGAARFDSVQLSAGQILRDPERARRFRRAERFHVLCALAHMLRGAGQDTSTLDADITSLDAVLFGEESVRAHLDALGSSVRKGFDALDADAAPALAEALRKDGRLLDMFAPAPKA